MYKHDFRCSSIKNKIWYQFKNHRWEELDNGVELRRRISNDVVNEYCNLSADFSKKAAELTDQDPNKEVFMSRSKSLTNISIQLRKQSMKKNIMEECAEYFYEPKFEELLDSKDNLIGFTNGVYDLEQKIFREGLPEDYISFSTNIDFIEELSQDDRERIEEVNTFLEQVLPVERVREYVLSLLSSFLTGKTGEEKFHIWTGSGGNGKSKLTELFKTAFGDYCGILPVTVLTQGRTASNAASPALAKTKGKRFCLLQEPEEHEQIHVGLMKELTGGDTIQARALHRDPVEFKPKFKMVLTCNELPSVPSTDQGTWRRIRVVEFISKFVDDPNPKNPYEFPRDLDLSEKMLEWPEVFMYLLIRYYHQYIEQGLREPEEVLKGTLAYKAESDLYSQFFQEYIEESPKGHLVLDVIYDLFKEWWRSGCGDKKPPTKKDLTKNMSKTYGKCDSRKRWKGIALINKDDDDEDQIVI